MKNIEQVRQHYIHTLKERITKRIVLSILTLVLSILTLVNTRGVEGWSGLVQLSTMCRPAGDPSLY